MIRDLLSHIVTIFLMLINIILNFLQKHRVKCANSRNKNLGNTVKNVFWQIFCSLFMILDLFSVS